MKRRSFLTGVAGLPFAGKAVAVAQQDMEGPHIHTPGDGRPPREVFVDGVRIQNCVYADTRRGVVRYHVEEGGRPVIQHGELLLGQAMGNVVVRPLSCG